MAVKKITRRWLFNSFGVILVVLLGLGTAASVSIYNYYINSVRQAITSRVDLVNLVFAGYAQNSGAPFSDQVRGYVQSFSDKNLMELMVIDSSGNITVTSSGFQPSDSTRMKDFEDAISSPEGYGECKDKIQGESIMAVSVVPVVSDPSVAAVRFVVSMDDIYEQVRLIILSVLVIVGAIIFFVLLSSLFFINSIVNPISLVGDSARRIAQGDFNAKLVKETDDEIGELCDIINYMADELSATERLKNDFISSVSHELRTPMTAIKGWAETIQLDEGSDKETLQKGMKVIISESERLSGMVEELLDFSRMQSGRLKLVMAKTDVLAELGDAVLMFTERAKRDGIELTYNDPEEIYPVYGDKNKLRQVFVNIIDNALKYSDSGGSVHVNASLSEDKNRVLITVADTGIGIGKEDLAKVKTKFYKVASTRRGSGIGLAVAEEIVTRHGGTLELTSELGVGTTASIMLPLQKKQDEATVIDLPAEKKEI